MNRQASVPYGQLDASPEVTAQLPIIDVVIPIAFPDYKIQVDLIDLPSKTVRTPFGSFSTPKVDLGFKMSNLGHAGVLFINGSTGLTKYYEFGRYDPANHGLVRRVPVEDVSLAADGHPTKESLERTLRTISQNAGKGTRIEGAYIATGGGSFSSMLSYAKEQASKGRKKYDIWSNSCTHFMKDVVEEGINQELDMSSFPSPNQYIDKIRSDYPNLDFEPASNRVTVKGAALSPAGGLSPMPSWAE